MSTYPDYSSVQLGASTIHTLFAQRGTRNESLLLGLEQGAASQECGV